MLERKTKTPLARCLEVAMSVTNQILSLFMVIVSLVDCSMAAETEMPSAGGTYATATPSDISTVVQIAAGGSRACALRKDGAVFCWGFLLSKAGSPEPSPKPVKIQNLPPVCSISTHIATSCAVDLEGKAWCWDLNVQDSIEKHEESVSSDAFAVKGLPPVKSISVGYLHACALAESGDVYCWGSNAAGELGSGGTKDASQPVAVPGIKDAVALGTGVNNSCAITSNGKVQCWGTDDPGLGKGFVVQSKKPVPVPFVDNLVKVVNGRNFFCGLQKTGKVVCWGSNIFHQLGASDTALYGAAGGIAATEEVKDANDIAVDFFNACAVVGTGAIKCWGLWHDPFPGKPEIPDRGQLPTPVAGIQAARQVAVGSDFACALLQNGKVMCWGSNDAGQLGDGTTTSSETPVEVLGLNQEN